MKTLVVFFLLMVLSGCGFVFQNLNERQDSGVSRGMNKEEVIRTLGAPQQQRLMSIEDREYEVWEYPKIEPKAKPLYSLPTKHYKVFFLEDKVVQWNEDKVFAQPSYEYLQTIAPEQKTTQVIPAYN